MATQSGDASAAPAQMIGNAFVEQYYKILCQNPEEAYRFYNDSSVLTRAGPDGVMTSINTVNAINEKLLSMVDINYKAEIMTVDAEYSHKEGLIVLVTGCLTGKDNVKRRFTESFFLVPQDKSYYVMNDIHRFLGDSEVIEADTVVDNNINESGVEAAVTPDPEPTHVPDHPAPEQTNDVEDNTTENNNAKEVDDHLAAEKVSVIEKDVVAEHPVDASQNAVSRVSETAAPKVQEDAPKKSFASVVSALKENNAPFHVRVSPVKPAEPVRSSVVPEAVAPIRNSTLKKTDDPAVKTYAIFVPNLPMDATVEQLEGSFKQFGPIKHDGIQVRSNKQQGSCFGFVEFESASSMQDAIQASPMSMFDREIRIEERRAANNDKGGRFSSGRGGYRNENFRGRGNVGGRGYDFERRGDFSGRARGNGGRNAETGQRVYQNGGGRAPRQAVTEAIN